MPRAGAHTASFYSKKNVQFVILYTNGVEKTGEYRVFHVKDTASKVTEERMRSTWYPFDVKGLHFFFRFDEEVNIGQLDINALLAVAKQKHLEEVKESADFEPLFCSAEDVLAYRTRLQ